MLRSYRPLEGFNVRRTSKGACIVEIDLEADPAKRSQEWQASLRRRLTDAEFQREYKRNWTVAKGKAYYPEFVIAPHLYLHKIPYLMDDVVYRGHDFGIQHPACVWAQYSKKQDRIWFLREILPANIDTHNMAHLVLYLSGELALSDLQKWPRATAWVNWVLSEHAKDPKRMPKPPWFEMGTRFLDYAGDEALKRSATVEGENAARTDMAVYQSYGIQLIAYQDSIASRETKMRKMLIQRQDGYPGLFIDPACHNLAAGFGGGVSYPEPTKATPEPTQPRRDGWYEHVHDCANYIVINTVPETLDIEGGKPAPNSQHDIQVMDFKETRESVW